MSYENKAKVSVLNYPNTSTKMNVCPKCSDVYDLDVKFCGKDGTELNETTVYSRVKNIISLFLDEYDEHSYLIDERGHSTGEGSDVHGLVRDLKKFSNKYPEALFQVDITWDSGFGDTPDRFYITDGKEQRVKAILTFEPFDKTKLK